MESISTTAIVCLAVAHAFAIEPDPRIFEMEDKTKLLYDVSHDAKGIVVNRIYHFTDPANKSVLWEFNTGWAIPVGFLPTPNMMPWIVGARRFGDTFCIIAETRHSDATMAVSYIRVDTSRIPHSWIEAKTSPNAKQMPPSPTRLETTVIESPFDVSLKYKGLEKVTYRVDDSGRIERNGVRIQLPVTINGKYFPEGTEKMEQQGKPVWPPKPGEIPGPNQPAVNAPKPGEVSSAIAPTTVESNQPRGHWRQWAGGAGILAILAGWFMFRKRTRAGRTGNTTSSGA